MISKIMILKTARIKPGATKINKTNMKITKIKNRSMLVLRFFGCLSSKVCPVSIFKVLL